MQIFLLLSQCSEISSLKLFCVNECLLFYLFTYRCIKFSMYDFVCMNIVCKNFVKAKAYIFFCRGQKCSSWTHPSMAFSHAYFCFKVICMGVYLIDWYQNDVPRVMLLHKFKKLNLKAFHAHDTSWYYWSSEYTLHGHFKAEQWRWVWLETLQLTAQCWKSTSIYLKYESSLKTCVVYTLGIEISQHFQSPWWPSINIWGQLVWGSYFSPWRERDEWKTNTSIEQGEKNWESLIRCALATENLRELNEKVQRENGMRNICAKTVYNANLHKETVSIWALAEISIHHFLSQAFSTTL